jgi:NAD(P)-dependent dehydrogenase (short-subunit alcohol dehydrogenase family)
MVVGAGAQGDAISIGRATAVTLARRGAAVFAVDMDADAARRTEQLIADEGGQARSFRADASDDHEMRRAVDACMGVFGRVDILDNNVGIMAFGDPVELSVEDWDRVTRVNGRSHFLACKYVLPHMIGGGGGAIVNISSIAAIRWTGAPYHVYNASKAAVIGFTTALALDYADRHIRANCVVPGFIDSPMMRSGIAARLGADRVDAAVEERARKCPLGRLGSPWDVANACAFLACDEAAYITGTTLVVDGGVTASCAL